VDALFRPNIEVGPNEKVIIGHKVAQLEEHDSKYNRMDGITLHTCSSPLISIHSIALKNYMVPTMNMDHF
jgi:hypothetical protein